MLAQEDGDKNERAIYYLSKTFHDYETRYIPVKKSCLCTRLGQIEVETYHLMF